MLHWWWINGSNEPEPFLPSTHQRRAQGAQAASIIFQVLGMAWPRLERSPPSLVARAQSTVPTCSKKELSVRKIPDAVVFESRVCIPVHMCYRSFPFQPTLIDSLCQRWFSALEEMNSFFRMILIITLATWRDRVTSTCYQTQNIPAQATNCKSCSTFFLSTSASWR